MNAAGIWNGGKIMIGDRIAVLEKFFKVRKPKNLDPVDWLDKLYEMEMEWEDAHQKSFPV